MSYEPELPPVPTREEELAMITRIEDDFTNQSYTKYYMNESLRINKLEFSDKLRNYKRRWWGNFFMGKLPKITTIPFLSSFQPKNTKAET